MLHCVIFIDIHRLEYYNDTVPISTLSIYWINFKPIKIYTHQGIIKIVDDMIFYDFPLISESVWI